ncbi:starvation-sensing protein RspA [Verminephrobacter aporrectodeae subsp. tuberculatae]|uniref:enolase C-terminal domain-like protein n=1 Tax=Verminephrobacter aporrectodeae TaxID=1110389 RepID=UPI002242D4D3|nr:enolase C-terminal domain-like protein [Verminephrobacter aporrectodeae]MCW8208627.1 starvation-sensing protein RspA [Verminephrobacter aporrectodeae subsp. tuberculatae]
MTTLITDIKTTATAPEGINLLVVQVETNQPGLVGLGCATFAYRHRAVECLIGEYLRPLLVGRNAEAIEELWQLMHQNAYWRNGPIENNAISGIDMALWDIKGKQANMPLYQLFGGKCREGVPIYRHADGRDLEELGDCILKYRAQGITHIRCQSGGYGGGRFGAAPAAAPRGALAGIYLDSREYMRDTLEMFDALRSRLGFGVELCHDVHERLKPADAIRFACALEPYALFFLEDAIALEDGDWLRQLRAKTTTPLAQGELFNHPFEWRPLIAERLIDYVRVHLSQVGGITPGRKLQLFAEQYGVRTAWHGPGDMSPLAHAANIHIDLAARNFGVQEWSGTEPPNSVIQDLRGPKEALLDVFPGLPEFRQGHVYANDKPGLGVDLDEAEAAKYPCENSVTTWTQTRLLMDGALQTP